MSPLPRLIALACLLATSADAAGIRVSLPLGEHCRPGHYVPVQVNISGDVPEGELHLVSPGAVTTVIEVRRRPVSCVVPWLVLEAPATLAWETTWGQRGTAGTLAPLGLEQSIVLAVGDVEPARPLLRRLFPAEPIVIRRDAVDPLPGPPTSWEILDSAIFDEAGFNNAGLETALSLAAGGTIIASPRRSPPDDNPWETIEGYYTLRFSPVGPSGATHRNVSIVYNSVANWPVQWPRSLRTRLLLIGVLSGLVLLGIATIWRWRSMPLVAVILSAGGCAALAGWWWSRSTILQRGGDIYIAGRTVQRDAWVVQASPARTTIATAWTPRLRPMLESPRTAGAAGMRLICTDTGAPQRLTYDLAARRPMVLLARSLVAGTPHPNPAAPPTNERTPLMDLAQSLYMRKGWSAKSVIFLPKAPFEPSPLDVTWPSIIIHPRPDR